MKELQNIGKRMPYAEHEDYLSQLVSNATEQAIRQGSQTRRHPVRMWAAAAVATLLLAGAGITYYHLTVPKQTLAEDTTAGPIDEFLDGLTDEEAQMLAYYEIEEIPDNIY